MNDMISTMSERFDLSNIKDKLTTVEDALAKIQSGDRIFVGSACATPCTMIKALETMYREFSDIELFHFLISGTDILKNNTNLKHRAFFVSSDIKEAVKQDQADYVPISITQVPRMIDNGGIAVDVALIQTSLPDENGFVSLGVSVGVARSAIKRAKTVIAEINPNMPRTMGDTTIPMGLIDHAVLVDTPIIEYLHEPVDAVAEQTARYIARIIDDGSTLQIGLGRIPNEMLKYLSGRRDLGLHANVITESVIDLIEKGIITGNQKSIHKGKVVCSYAIGSRRLYDYIDNNPTFSFHPIDYICNPEVMAHNTKLVSVNQAFSVDLTGQVCTDQFDGEFYGGVSTLPDFLRGAASTPGGKPIICLSSTTDDGKISRIRPLLKEGEGVSVARSDVHYIITEFGSAYLFVKSIRERALALIEIAHPDFRPALLDEAKKLGYVRKDQTLKSKMAYPAGEEREVVLKDQRKVLLRPSKASDVTKLQQLFYNLSRDDIYTRFFSLLEALSISRAEHLCNVNYETEMAFVAVVGDREKDLIVGSSCYFLDPSTNLAEVAYMNLPEWQNTGLGTALQKRMIEHAQAQGIRGFTASILAQNKKMISLAKAGFSSVKMRKASGEYEVTMLF